MSKKNSNNKNTLTDVEVAKKLINITKLNWSIRKPKRNVKEKD